MDTNYLSTRELTIPEYRKALNKGSKNNAVEIALYHIERCRVLEKKLKSLQKNRKLDKNQFDNVNLATWFPVKSTDIFIEPPNIKPSQKKSEIK